MAQIGKSVKQFLGFGKTMEPDYEKTDLEGYGVKTVIDKRFETRLQDASKLIEAIRLGYVEVGGELTYLTVHQRIALTDELVHKCAVPYMTVGDRPVFIKAVRSWEKLIGRWTHYQNLNEINEAAVKFIIYLMSSFPQLHGMSEQDRHEWFDNCYQQFESVKAEADSIRVSLLTDAFGLEEIIPRGMMIYDYSWFKSHVTPQTVTVIQSTMPTGERGIQPFYKSKYGEGAGGGKTRET